MLGTFFPIQFWLRNFTWWADSTCNIVTKSQMGSLDSLPLLRYSHFFLSIISENSMKTGPHTCGFCISYVWEICNFVKQTLISRFVCVVFSPKYHLKNFALLLGCTVQEEYPFTLAHTKCSYSHTQKSPILCPLFTPLQISVLLRPRSVWDARYLLTT